MAALTTERRTSKRSGDLLTKPVAASTKCFAGGMACIDSADGFVKPGAVSTTLVTVGKFAATADNSAGANGDINAEIECGIFEWENSAAGDLIADDDIGKLCYVVDDQTVALTDGTSTRSVAGRIHDVDPVTGRVWVDHNIRS